jgi:hypothetical protein
MLEAEWRICSSEISLQAADMPTCSNSVTFKIDFDFAAVAIASALVRLELNTILDIPSERLDSLMSRAKEHNDLMMLKTLCFSGECFYHLGCIRRFLLHSTPLKEETEQSAHEVSFDCLISRISDDLFV